MSRVAAVDCGTNTIRLLIADGPEPAPNEADAGSDNGQSVLRDIVRRTDFVRLGEGLDASGSIAPAAMQRTLTMAHEYAALCAEHQVERVRFVATSASRDAANADEFVAGIQSAFAGFQVSPEVVTGVAEAALSFRGATGGLAAAGVLGPYLVVDLGGGSTEVVRGLRQVESAVSLDIGCVRLTERHLHSDPPSDAQVAAATAAIDTAIDHAESAVDFSGVGTLVGLAGSVTTITAHALQLPHYDRSAIDGATMPVSQVLASCTALAQAGRSERMALPFMHEGRVDVIVAGALIWSRVVSRVVARSDIAHVRVSESDILDGIALSLFDHP